MARRPRPELAEVRSSLLETLRVRPAPRTEPGFRPNPRAPKFVDEANFRYFHKRRRELEKLWLGVDPDSFGIMRDMRTSAREALRAEMRAVTSTGPAVYLIPV